MMYLASMAKLPIGIQDFKKLREDGYLYVDKTQQIFEMVEAGSYHFLSRPRRFGKSLLVTTLSELFKGNRALFEGLWIENHWNWGQRHPVIYLFFNDATYKSIGLARYIAQELHKHATFYGLELQQDADYAALLRQLIEQLSARYGRVVFLVDEYDKPIIDYLDDVPTAKANQEVMKNFYSVLKPLDGHLRFVFITGVSKFSRVSIFSEMNNLLDLTLHPRFGALLGYTQHELETSFTALIGEVAPAHGGKAALLAKMAKWYNGYSWNGRTRVYNPWSVLNFFSAGEFTNFWFQSGTPTFLVKLLDRSRTYDLDYVEADPSTFDSFELEHIDPHTLMFQTGYLTILKVEDGEIYTLGYPNKEVRQSFLRYLLAQASQSVNKAMSPKVVKMRNALRDRQPEVFVEVHNALFSSLPYQVFIADKEAYYHSITFLALSLMGTHAEAEASQAHGRPDCVVHFEDSVFIIEFKLDQSAEAAIAQIKAQQYAQPYLADGKDVELLGLNFSSVQKGVDSWLLTKA